MGLVVHLSTGQPRALPPRALVGRSAACVLRSDDPWVSAEHASLWWRDGWWLRDLGSRNGTFVNEVRLDPGEAIALTVGARIRFGETDIWILEDAGAPRARAVEVGGDGRADADAGVLVLPPDGVPEVAVVHQPDGIWVADEAHETRPVSDGDVVVAGDRAWRLVLPMSLDPTMTAGPPISLRFRVSSDEEVVEVSVVCGGATGRLEARSSNYLLLQLARGRIADAGLPEPEQGWMYRDELARMLRISPTTVNVQLHRLRQALAPMGPDLAARLIQNRMVRSRQVRLGVSAVQIEDGRATVPT